MDILKSKIGFIGGGNIGSAIIKGFIRSNKINHNQIFLLEKDQSKRAGLKSLGINFVDDDEKLLKVSEILIVAVRPQHFSSVLESISHFIDSNKHLLISIVTGMDSKTIQTYFKHYSKIVRVMPNTAIALCESMNCIASDISDPGIIESVQKLFSVTGESIIVQEKELAAATAICSCGTAFFLRMIRAASQGGVQIGFHAEDAIKMAAQTAKGSASLLLETGIHPEQLVDNVTTPGGLTIEGLNQMEFSGLSSAIINGINAAFNKGNKIKS